MLENVSERFMICMLLALYDALGPEPCFVALGLGLCWHAGFLAIDWLGHWNTRCDISASKTGDEAVPESIRGIVTGASRFVFVLHDQLRVVADDEIHRGCGWCGHSHWIRHWHRRSGLPVSGLYFFFGKLDLFNEIDFFNLLDVVILLAEDILHLHRMPAWAHCCSHSRIKRACRIALLNLIAVVLLFGFCGASLRKRAVANIEYQNMLKRRSQRFFGRRLIHSKGALTPAASTPIGPRARL
jgi:hypothetical protein